MKRVSGPVDSKLALFEDPYINLLKKNRKDKLEGRVSYDAGN